MRTGAIILMILLSSALTYAQDAPKPKPFAFLTDTAHNPKKAVFFSAILPGSGQLYNRKYWKTPIVYTGFATIGYLAWQNNALYQTYRSAYTARNDNDPATVDTFPSYISAASLKANRDYYRRNRDLSYIGIGVWYILQLVDANVDAHLFTFTTSDDLSFHWQPIWNQPRTDRVTAGINLQLTF